MTASLLPRVVDLERIEVLRGPQGSLCGARSLGGTIRLITKRPSLNVASGNVRASTGSVKDGDLNHAFDVSYSFPVVEDKFGLHVSAYWGSNSGVQDRVFQPTYNEVTRGIVRSTVGPDFGENEDVDDETFWGAQISGNVKINDNLTFIPKVMMQKIDVDGLPVSFNPIRKAH
jgi:outer membrane receptor for ferrienterochelin and colicin|tara:strand:- start:256 stop:774 length:519 start_codon:yes stop_codon:yes gene_type:complete